MTRFPDPRQLLDLDGRDFIVCAYRVLLRREADPRGFELHMGQLRRGRSKLQIIRSLRFSTEGRKIAADVSVIRLELAVAWWYSVPVLGRVVRSLAEFLGFAPGEDRRRVLERHLSEQGHRLRLVPWQASPRGDGPADIDWTLYPASVKQAYGELERALTRATDGPDENRH